MDTTSFSFVLHMLQRRYISISRNILCGNWHSANSLCLKIHGFQNSQRKFPLLCFEGNKHLAFSQTQQLTKGKPAYGVHDRVSSKNLCLIRWIQQKNFRQKYFNHYSTVSTMLVESFTLCFLHVLLVLSNSCNSSN